jgi:hypothetical protein
VAPRTVSSIPAIIGFGAKSTPVDCADPRFSGTELCNGRQSPSPPPPPGYCDLPGMRDTELCVSGAERVRVPVSMGAALAAASMAVPPAGAPPSFDLASCASAFLAASPAAQASVLNLPSIVRHPNVAAVASAILAGDPRAAFAFLRWFDANFEVSAPGGRVLRRHPPGRGRATARSSSRSRRCPTARSTS